MNAETETRDLVIIGSGMAGYTLLREIRKLDKELQITLICADRGDFYSKPMLSNALDKQKTPDSLVTQSAEAISEALNFELVNHTTVTAIDPAQQRIDSSSGSWTYQRLVLATGARQFVLPIDGDGAGDILSVNSLDDYRQFHLRLDDARKIAIIGPGLIGCEFANDLALAGKQVSVIGPDPWPLSTLLPEQAGQFLHAKLAQQGIGFHLQNTVQSVQRGDDGYQLALADDSQLEADLVLSAVGLRANLDLAESSGLNTDRGYVTDRLLQTSIENIYALGDCAEVEGRHLPYILPIMQCARALARTLTGYPTEVRYPAMPVTIKTPSCPIVVAPAAQADAEWRLENTEDGIKALQYVNDDLVGFVLVGDAVTERQALSRLVPDVL
ncbi:MAG: FAD-dependent oxidoreductase [Gammaproteobacteria bacterium]|nr:FAD-dependent oxidoreductase [Gammaproteobacteria bacterium]